MKGRVVFAVPFLLSLALSASTVGTHVYWQDSGFYLVAVHELSILYPPGFAVYQLLCKAWTTLLFFVDFTLAVHLFSSLCAALAAGTIAVAARELLRSKGALFKVRDDGDPRGVDGAAIAAGVMAAAGYTFWYAATTAKGYALDYFVLALLLWRMIRAHETGAPRDFTIVAALIGLSWTAHPSSALLGPAFIAFVVAHRANLGTRALLLRIGVSAGVAILPSFLLLLLARRESLDSMGEPRDLKEFFVFLLGTPFTGKPGVFGLDASRVFSYGRYLWEEFLGAGLIALLLGLLALVRANRRLLAAALLWILPFSIVTILFKMEGQQDCWFVAAWLPLFLIVAVGLDDAARRAGRHGRAAVAGIAGISLAWAAAVNQPQLNLRHYELAETYGRLFLEPLDPEAVLVLAGDDRVAICTYLQRVRKVRPDVTIVNATRLESGNPSHGYWYLDRLMRAHPSLRRPDVEGLTRRFGGRSDETHAAAAFLNANLGAGRPLFTSVRPLPAATDPRVSLVPAGILWKALPRGQEVNESKYWQAIPVAPEDILPRFRRERGQNVRYENGQVKVEPECYERRLFRLLAGGRAMLGMSYLRQGRFDKAAPIFQWSLEAMPEPAEVPQLRYLLAHATYGMNRLPDARRLYEDVLKQSAEPDTRAGSLLFLGLIARKEGRDSDARRHWELALQVPGADPRIRGEVEEELRKP